MYNIFSNTKMNSLEPEPEAEIDIFAKIENPDCLDGISIAQLKRQLRDKGYEEEDGRQATFGFSTDKGAFFVDDEGNPAFILVGQDLVFSISVLEEGSLDRYVSTIKSKQSEGFKKELEEVKQRGSEEENQTDSVQTQATGKPKLNVLQPKTGVEKTGKTKWKEEDEPRGFIRRLFRL